MSRDKYPRRKDRFAFIPTRILKTPEFKSLRYSAKHVLLCIAGQFIGLNNGRLTMTEEDGQLYGVRKQTRSHALRDLERLGFIVKTKQGGMRPMGPTHWALPWNNLHYRNGRQLDSPIKAERWANAAWANENRSTGAESAPRTGSNGAPRKPANGCGKRTTVGRLTGAKSAPQSRISPRVPTPRTDSETENRPRNGAENGD